MSVDWVDYFITIGRDRAMTQAGIDNSNTARYQYNKLLSELAALRARITELEAATVLTPRQCNRDCFERGWHAMREAACTIVQIWAGFPVFFGQDDRRLLMNAIASTQPTDCDCNPLAPDAKP